MKVVAINCSARKDGNTAHLLGVALAEIGKEAIETELLQLADLGADGVFAGFDLAERGDYASRKMPEDKLSPYIEKMLEADGILIGSPAYVGDLSALAKVLIERATFAAKFARGDNPLRRKVGAAVVTHRRAGAMPAFDAINHFFLMNEMIVPGSTYWNIGLGKHDGEVEGDDEGIVTMCRLGQNFAWLMKKIS